jgi:hypothetical protein
MDFVAVYGARITIIAGYLRPIKTCLVPEDDNDYHLHFLSDSSGFYGIRATLVPKSN